MSIPTSARQRRSTMSGTKRRVLDAEQRRALVASLRARNPDLVAVVATHVESASRLEEDESGHESECHAVVSDVIDFTLGGIERGDKWADPLPSRSIMGARRAAQEKVPLTRLLHGYHACQAKLTSMLMEEIERGDWMGQRAALRLVLEVHALHSRFTSEIAAEHGEEAVRAVSAQGMGRAERVERLLLGTSFDSSGLDYELNRRWHIGVIAKGSRAVEAVAMLARAVECELLALPHQAESVHAWLGSTKRLGAHEISEAFARIAPDGVVLALGEPGAEIDGWRLTHRQAQAALRVALQGCEAVTTFAEASLLAPWMSDPALARSFLEIHLSPLEDQRDGGVLARETIREYFKAGHQVAAAASALKVDRGTLRRRLATIESRLGCALSARQAELEVALRLEALNGVKEAALNEWKYETSDVTERVSYVVTAPHIGAT